MTDVLSGAVGSAYADETQAAPAIWVRGACGAAWSVAVGLATVLVLVLTAWATDSRGTTGAGAALHAALQVWLLAHRVPMHLGSGTLALAPLLLTGLFAWLIARAARIVARGADVTTVTGVGAVAVAVGVPYAVLTTFVAAGARTASVRPAPIAALATGLALGLVAGAVGASRGASRRGLLLGRLPGDLALAVRAAGRAAAVLLGAAVVAVLIGVGAHGSAVLHASTALGGGAVSVAALGLLDLALLPNAACWALGYLAGPGFAVGAGSTVSLTVVQHGGLPALPLLAALPTGPAGPAGVTVALVTLVAAGATAATVVVRGGLPLLASMRAALVAGALTGLLVMAVVTLADGPAGPGAMATVGASPWQTGGAVAAEIAVVAAGLAGVFTWRRGR